MIIVDDTTATVQSKSGRRVERVGYVVSDKGDKTIKVKYQYLRKHPKYGKYIRRTTIMHAHDEKNEAKVGDKVEVVATRRLSKTKYWRLRRIIQSDCAI